MQSTRDAIDAAINKLDVSIAMAKELEAERDRLKAEVERLRTALDLLYDSHLQAVRYLNGLSPTGQTIHVCHLCEAYNEALAAV